MISTFRLSPCSTTTLQQQSLSSCRAPRRSTKQWATTKSSAACTTGWMITEEWEKLTGCDRRLQSFACDCGLGVLRQYFAHWDDADLRRGPGHIVLVVRWHRELVEHLLSRNGCSRDLCPICAGSGQTAHLEGMSTFWLRAPRISKQTTNVEVVTWTRTFVVAESPPPPPKPPTSKSMFSQSELLAVSMSSSHARDEPVRVRRVHTSVSSSSSHDCRLYDTMQSTVRTLASVTKRSLTPPTICARACVNVHCHTVSQRI